MGFHEQNYWLTSTHRGAHLDSICHVAFDGKTYNGYVLTEIASKAGGCSKMGIGGVKDKFVTRGILVDIARMKGLERLAPGTHIYREDIEDFEKWANVRFEPGDLFLYRLGGSEGSGLDPSFVPFLKERGRRAVRGRYVPRGAYGSRFSRAAAHGRHGAARDAHARQP